MKLLMPDLIFVYHTVPGPNAPSPLAAIVATGDLQVAFTSTKHTAPHVDWRENQNVLPTGYSSRSTMTGDYMRQGNKLFLVEDLGFSYANGPRSKAQHAVKTISKWIAVRRKKWNV